MKATLYFTLFLLCFAQSPTYAQFQGKIYEPFYNIPVDVNGSGLLSPWCGGINSVQLNLADLNNDGKEDLVLYDQNNYTIKTFLNVGNSGDIKYQFVPGYDSNFPYIYDYMILKDYNCDGIPDLFHKGISGVSVSKGYYQNNQLKFSYYKNLYCPYNGNQTNVYVQPSDIPTIVDVDNDGDLDVLAFEVLGSQLIYYRNMQVEDGLPCDSMRMVIFDNCYGKFIQTVNKLAVLGVTCKGGSGGTAENKTRHVGNCMVHLDLDGDGKLDMLDGNISFSDLQALYNSGSNTTATYTSQDTSYNQLSHVLQMPSWPAPFHLDIDHDGVKDLLVSSHNDNLSSANYNAVAYYKNMGTNTIPNFVFQHDTLFTPDMIDVGAYSYPTFFDYDKDGKKDLFVGTEGYFNNVTLSQKCKLAYYHNTSTLGNTSFELITKDFLNLSSKNYHGLFPTFGDITGDGIDDLVMGNVDGTIAYFKNTAGSNTVVPNFVFGTDSVAGIDVGKYSAPIVYDFDQDGKTDLLIGNQTGHLAYYRDTSTTSTKKLALLTITIGNFKAGSVNQFYGYCVPFIGKIDNTQKDYLMIGNIDGTVARYDSFENNFLDFKRIDSNYSFIKTISRSVPAFADLDGDGKYEMVIGNKLGGLNYYKQTTNVTSSTTDLVFNENSIEVYPNPTSDNLNLLLKNNIKTQLASLTVYDVTGKPWMHQTFKIGIDNKFDMSHLASGIYLVEVRIGNKKVLKKIIKSDK